MKNQVRNLALVSSLLCVFITTTTAHAIKKDQDNTQTNVSDKSTTPTDVVKPKPLADQQAEANIEKVKAEIRKANIDTTKGVIDIATNGKVLAAGIAPIIIIGGLVSAKLGKNPMIALWRLSAKVRGSYNAQAAQEEELAKADALNKRTPAEQEELNNAEARKAEIAATNDRYKQCLTIYPQSGRAIPANGVEGACAEIKNRPTELQAIALEKERYEQCLRDYPKSGRSVPLTGITGACSQISNDPTAIQSLSNDIRIAEETRAQIAKNEAQYLACVPGSGYASVGGCAATAIPVAVNLVTAFAAIRNGLFPAPRPR